MGTLYSGAASVGGGSLWGDYCAAFTRIGNALGLEGVFPVHFGYEQIEQRAKDWVVLAEGLDRHVE